MYLGLLFGFACHLVLINCRQARGLSMLSWIACLIAVFCYRNLISLFFRGFLFLSYKYAVLLMIRGCVRAFVFLFVAEFLDPEIPLLNCRLARGLQMLSLQKIFRQFLRNFKRLKGLQLRGRRHILLLFPRKFCHPGKLYQAS